MEAPSDGLMIFTILVTIIDMFLIISFPSEVSFNIATIVRVYTRSILIQLNLIEPSGLFLESPENFSGPKSHS